MTDSDAAVNAAFPAGIATNPILVYAEGNGPAVIADRVRALPGVTTVRVAAQRDGAALLTVGYTGEPTGTVAYDTVRAIRALPIPAGARLLVGGSPARDIDLAHDLGRRLPWLAAIMIGVTIVLLLFAFGSVLLPVKGVLMNLVSIGASFGAVVWVFQDGHLAGWLGFTPTGYLEPNLPVLIFAVLFGLSTDYEVFLLSRIREQWDRTGDNRAAVAAGMQRTGRIITAAALLLVLVVAGFTTGQVVFAKLIGIGMITAVVVDATPRRLGGYGYCASHSRFFWGLRLYLVCTPTGMPILWALPTRRSANVRSSPRCSRSKQASSPNTTASC